MNPTRPRPLDFVLTPEGQVAMVTECSAQFPDRHGDNSANRRDYLKENAETGDHYRTYAVTIIGPNQPGERCAWYPPDELTVIDSLPRLLANNLQGSHSGRDGFVEHYFGDMSRPAYGDPREAGLHR